MVLLSYGYSVLKVLMHCFIRFLFYSKLIFHHFNYIVYFKVIINLL